MNSIQRIARGLRFSITYQQLKVGNITKDEAKEILSGALSPGDETTIVDDSYVLDMSEQEIIIWIGELLAGFHDNPDFKFE